MKRSSSLLGALSVLASISFTHQGARAQPVDDPASTAAAQALFEQAARALEAGDLATACPKFAEVVRLEPRGAGGRLKLAHCYERQGRFASAWATYLAAESAARTSGQRERARDAHDAADRLRPELSTLTVTVPAGAAGPTGSPSAFIVLRDGADLGAPQWNEPVPVDGGEHVVELRKEGEPTARFRTSIVVAAKEAHETLAIPEDAFRVPLAATPIAPAALEPREGRDLPSSPAPQPPPRDEPEPAGGIPTWAIVVGMAGIAMGGTAVILRAHAGSIEADQEEHCGPSLDACPRDYDVEGTNATKNASFGLFVGMGVASLAALSVATVGAVVGLSQPPPAHGPAVAFGPDGFLVGGAAQW